MKKLDVELSIYTFDIDFAGHVGNSVYLRWVEMGRCKFMGDVNFPVHTSVENDFIPVIVNTNITYKKPLYLGNKVFLKLWLSQLTKVTHTIEFRFYNEDGILACTGSQKGVFVNPKTLKPCSPSSDVRDLFLPYLHEHEDS